MNDVEQATNILEEIVTNMQSLDEQEQPIGAVDTDTGRPAKKRKATPRVPMCSTRWRGRGRASNS